MGRIASEECFCMDMEWFGVDKCGNIAVFCSAGCGYLPEFVCEDEERAVALIEFFEQMQAFTKSVLHFDLRERFKEVAKEFSDKGLFYFDSDDCTRPGISTLHEYYTKVSSPVQALKVTDLPENVQEMLKNNLMEIEDFSATDRVHVTHAYE